MKKRIIALIAIFAMISPGIEVFASTATDNGYGSEYRGYISTPNTYYSDVPSSHWAYDAITRVGEKGWFDGYPDGKFRPNGEVTRAEAIKVLVVSQGGSVTPISSTSYPDVSAGDWYAPFIEAGKDVNGNSLLPVRTNYKGETPFLPGTPVTREDVVYALVKVLGMENLTVVTDQSVLNMFRDANSISNNIKPYLAVALTHQLVSGFDDDTIRAQDPLSRAEFATMLYRATLLGYLN